MTHPAILNFNKRVLDLCEQIGCAGTLYPMRRRVEIHDGLTDIIVTCTFRCDHVNQNARCFGLTADTYEDTLPKDINLADWLFLGSDCHRGTACRSLGMYYKQVLPWVTAGRLMPQLADINLASDDYYLSDDFDPVDRSCIICLNNIDEDGNYLPYRCICCRDETCRDAMMGFLWCSFAHWVIQGLLPRDVANLVSLGLASMHLREALDYKD